MMMKCANTNSTAWAVTTSEREVESAAESAGLSLKTEPSDCDAWVGWGITDIVSLEMGNKEQDVSP